MSRGTMTFQVRFASIIVSIFEVAAVAFNDWHFLLLAVVVLDIIVWAILKELSK
jgi:hypothetical protein